jgi:hypothetical protein
VALNWRAASDLQRLRAESRLREPAVSADATWVGHDLSVSRAREYQIVARLRQVPRCSDSVMGLTIPSTSATRSRFRKPLLYPLSYRGSGGG